MKLAPRRAAAALVASSLLAASPALAGRGFAVRSYDGGSATDSGSGDREPDSGGATAAFWFPNSLYDNPTGGYVPTVVRLAVGGERKVWSLDPSNARGYTLEIVRRDPVSGRIWIARGFTDVSFVYRLDPATNQVRRFTVPWRVAGLEVTRIGQQVWLVGPGRVAILDPIVAESATPSLLVYPMPAGVETTARLDAQRRLWLPTEAGGLVMFPTTTRNWVTYPGVPGMISPSFAESGDLWGVRPTQDRIYRWSAETRVLTTFPLPNAASLWAGIGATGAGVDLASAYGPHFLTLDPARLTGSETSAPTPAPVAGTVTTMADALAVETRTAAPVVDDLVVVDRIVWVEDDRGRGLHARNGVVYTALLFSGNGETFVGRTPVEWWRPVTGPFTARAVLPVVAEVRPNDPASNFLTEATLTNVDADPAITLALKTTTGTFTATVTLAAGRTTVFPNVVTALRDRGAAIPAGDVAGTLTATFTNGSGKLAARVYTLFGAGAAFPAGSTTGSSYTSLDPQNELFAFRKSLNGLKNTAAFRTNVAVANLCGTAGCEAIGVTANFYDDATGRFVGVTTFNVPPGEWRQVNAPLALFPDATGETFSVNFTPSDGRYAAYDAYATVIDNANQDSAFVRASAVAGSSRQTLPVIVDAAGVGTRFTSECAITNTTNGTVVADVAFTSVGTGNVVSEVLTLGPLRGVRYANAVDHFRQLVPGNVGADDFGPLRIVFRDFATGFASARTVASNRTGFGVTALDPSFARPQARKRILGLKQTAAYRTNLAVLHLGATTNDPDAPITLEVRITDANGAAVGSPLTATLQPGRVFQWSGVLATLGVSGEGYLAVIDRISGQDPFDAYVTVIDNVSSDPSFQRAE